MSYLQLLKAKIHNQQFEHAEHSTYEPTSLLAANDETPNRYLETHAAVKAFYLMHGRTEADWEKVNNDPAKFNYVWRLMLGMEPNGKPPFIGGRHD